MKKSIIVVTIICLAALASMACAAPPPPAPGTPSGVQMPPTDPGMPPSPPGMEQTPVATNSVTIEGYKFVPQVISVTAGAKVTWTNKDADPHSINSRDDVFNSPNLNQGESFSYTFDKAGTYTYVDKLHLQLNPGPYLGTIVVK